MPQQPLYLFILDHKTFVASNGAVERYRGPFETLFADIRRKKLSVRTLGIADNFELICKLHQACAPRSSVHVLNPRCVNDAGAILEPPHILHAMKMCDKPASCGGWVTITDRVLPAMQLAAYGRTKLELPHDRDMAFISNVNMEAVNRLVACIGDPRWFLNSDGQLMLRKFYGYMGIHDSADINIVINPNSSNRQRRFRTAVTAWGACRPVGDLTLPGEFLWRAYTKKSDQRLATISTTKLFLNYFIRVWHKRLYPDGHPHMRDVFQPHRFFNAADAAAYDKHLMVR